MVLGYAVDHHLDRLPAISRIKHHRLIQVHVLLRNIYVVHHQFKISVLMLGVGLLQAQAERAIRLEMLALIEIKFVVVPLALLLQQDQLVMSARDGALQFRARAVQVLARGLDLLSLFVELGLHLFPAGIVLGTAVHGLMFDGGGLDDHDRGRRRRDCQRVDLIGQRLHLVLGALQCGCNRSIVGVELTGGIPFVKGESGRDRQRNQQSDDNAAQRNGSGNGSLFRHGNPQISRCAANPQRECKCRYHVQLGGHPPGRCKLLIALARDYGAAGQPSYFRVKVEISTLQGRNPRHPWIGWWFILLVPDMPVTLSEIVAATRLQVEWRKHVVSVRQLEAQAAKHVPRGFRQALENKAAAGVAVIAEIKKASPSRGVIRGTLHVGHIAQSYERHGAAALSVLTEEQYFQGSLANLLEASAATRLPCLRKDFIIDEYQLIEARAHRADAVLLLASVLNSEQMAALYRRARELDLDVLCEVHDQAELQRALALPAEIIGVNNRDLRTFQVDLNTAIRLAELIPAGVVKVAESGIRSGDDIGRLRDLGYHAFLVGESLMRADDPGEALENLLSPRAQAKSF